MKKLDEEIEKRLGALRFDHKRLVAYEVALEAMLRGSALLDCVPRGHATLVDQTRRALESAYLNTSEGAGKTGAAGLTEPNETMEVLELLDRLCGLLTGLAHMRN